MDFIPLAEETGLIVTLGAWVLEEACRQVAAWRATVAPSLELSVNVATRQLSDPGLPAIVKDVLERSGTRAVSSLPRDHRVRAACSSRRRAAASLRALREIGVKVAVDDFGAGYSSLLYLKHFPVQILKLDRFFVSGISHNDGDAAIAGSVVRLAHSLGLSAVAEGVETAEQRAMLEELGCEQAQGFLWSPARGARGDLELLDSSLLLRGALPRCGADPLLAPPEEL